MRRLRALPLLLCAVLAACTTLPRPGAPALPDINFRLRDFKLPNGMRILVEEDHGSPLVGVFTVVGVGSSGDPKGKEGLAHLLEHLTFRAKHDGRVTVWNRLEFAGASMLNAFTNFDTTVYYELGPKEMLPNLLAIEGARIAQPVPGVDENTVTVEREVVRNELRQRGEMAIGPAMPWLQAAVFPKEHPYSRPIGGSHESLNAISLADVKAFTDKYYRPENITLLIVGDVDLATIDKVVDKAMPRSLYTIPSGPKPTFGSRLSAVAPEPPTTPPSKGLTKYQAVVPTPELYVSWSLPRSVDASSVLQQFVTISAQQTLAEAWQSDSDIQSVEVFRIDGVEASMLVARVPLRTGDHAERSMERVLDQLVKLWTNSEAGSEDQGAQATETMLRERAFARLRASAVMRLAVSADDIGSRGPERAVATHFTGDPLVYSRNLKALGAVTPGQVSEFAVKYLQRDRARGILVEPLKADAKAQGGTGLGDASGASNEVKATYSADEVRALGKAQLVKGAVEETLPNGLQVVVVPRRGGLPLVSVALGMPGGRATSQPPAAADLAEEIGRAKGHHFGHPSDFGIFQGGSLGTDANVASMDGANGNLPNMLAILSESLKTQYVEPGSAVLYKKESLEYLEKAEQLPESQAERKTKAALFGAHPYAHETTAKELEALGDSEASTIIERSYTPKGAMLVIAGDVDPALVLPQVREWFGDWKPRGEPLPTPAKVTLPSAARQVVVQHRPGASQVEVELNCLAPEPTPRQEAAQAILAEMVGATLFRRVREELGATYGFHGSSHSYRAGVGQLTWEGSVEKDRFTKALGTVKDVLDKTAALDEQAVGKARWELARRAAMRNSTAGRLARTVLGELLLGRPAASADEYVATLAAVTKDDLTQAWAQCQQSGVYTFVGDKDAIEAAVKAVGW